MDLRVIAMDAVKCLTQDISLIFDGGLIPSPRKECIRYIVGPAKTSTTAEYVLDEQDV